MWDWNLAAGCRRQLRKRTHDDKSVTARGLFTRHAVPAQPKSRSHRGGGLTIEKRRRMRPYYKDTLRDLALKGQLHLGRKGHSGRPQARLSDQQLEADWIH
jgi:hypothetical protein